MKRFTLLTCCLVAIASLGFWRLTAQPEPFIHAQRVASAQVVDHRQIEQLERHLDELIHEAEKLEKAGKHEHAERIHHEIERIEKHLHQMHEQAERAEHHEPAHHFTEAEQKRDHLLEAAENLRHADKPELAEQLQHEAEEIERHLQHLQEREHGHHRHNPLEPIMHELHGLRKEVAELREQIHELREVIEEAVEEHEDEDEAETDGEEELDISQFELEPGADPVINSNGLKVFIQQLGKKAQGKVQVHGKVQIKSGNSEDVRVFVFDQDDLEAGELSKVFDLDDLKLGTGTKGLNLKSIIQQAVGKIPSADKKTEESENKQKVKKETNSEDVEVIKPDKKTVK